MDKDKIKHLAELSKIAFTDDELSEISSDMSNIIKLMDKVRDFDTDADTYTLNSVDCMDLRADIPSASLDNAEVVKNAKTVTGGCFTVPKIV